MQAVCKTGSIDDITLGAGETSRVVELTRTCDFVVNVDGTFGGATCTMQISVDGGSTWSTFNVLDPESGAYADQTWDGTDVNPRSYRIGGVKFRWVNTGGDGTTAIVPRCHGTGVNIDRDS